MAGEVIDIGKSNVISKQNTGFPEYLDFDKLRAESIGYLGELSGKIWTDHNVHDPGITILEALIYAIMDLGYRTSLPTEDILAPNPEDKSPDDNFFTAARILGCNPLTITDYRKLLVDIEGVKNAFLFVADDITIESICGKQEQPDDFNKADNPNGHEDEPDCCIEYLNGLYHVYLEIEHRFPDSADEQKKFQECVVEKVRRTLMARRNLCEDFVDIHILCRFQTGICVDVELEPTAEAENVYVRMVEAVREFLSPSPKFYTLQQMLDKGVPVEEIFAGRPYNIEESHGFVDTREFEAIKLKREIHLSDVYAVLLGVNGVKAIRNLKLRRCDESNTATDVTAWKISLPKDHVPNFSINCSGFHFTRNGTTVFVDTKKFSPYFGLNFSNNGSAIYPASSPYLDAAVKYGVYRGDLSDYQSVQNEFPAVYGIGNGQLSSEAKPERKAKALQLKAYLLFFDQLLANYLSQLKNIRTLFALSEPADDKRHSYFINRLDSVPEMSKLLRFKSDDTDSNLLGSGGTALAGPIDRKVLQDRIDDGTIKDIDPANTFKGFTFGTIAECKVLMNLLRSDLQNDGFKPTVVATTNNRYFFYFFTSSESIAILGRKYYGSEKEAFRAAVSVQFLATLDENYRRFTDPCTNGISFDIEFNLSGYIANLQTIIETGKEFSQRRNIFLDHLLSRFSERFADYALLSFRQQPEALLNSTLAAKGKFLANYPDLSSNRGRAHDYSLDGWNNDNVSGFERRFKALAGIENWQRHSLCNFVVEAEDEEFVVSIPYGENLSFNSNRIFDKEGAILSAKAFFGSLANGPEFSNTETIGGNYEVYSDGLNNRYSTGPFASEKAAVEHAIYLDKLFKFNANEKDVFESGYIYHIQLKRKNSPTETLRTYNLPYSSKEEVKQLLGKAFEEINKDDAWIEHQPLNDSDKKPLLVAGKNLPSEYMDLHAFKIDINDTIEEKPGLFNYEVLDREFHKFKLISVNEFQSADEAEDDCQQLLFLLTHGASYIPGNDEDTGKSFIQIASNGVVVARSEIFKSYEVLHKKIGEIRAIAEENHYILDYDTQPDKWKFRYRLSSPTADYYFHSKSEYNKKPLAVSAAQTFSGALAKMVYDGVKQELNIPGKSKLIAGNSTVLYRAEDVSAEEAKEERSHIAEALLDKQRYLALATTREEQIVKYLQRTARSNNGDYVYRLVDKDNLVAVYQAADLKIDCDNDKQRRAVFNQLSLRNLDWIEISQGSDIIVEKQDRKTSATWYHYQLKCLNRFDSAGSELVLFESVQGYSDAAVARNAFVEEYFVVLQKALDPQSYGVYISLTELVLHATGACARCDSKVFIPRKTLNEWGTYDADAVRNIIALVHLFPLRSVLFQSDEFERLFLCLEDTAKEKAYVDKCSTKKAEGCDCRGKEKTETVYFFVTETWSNGVSTREWQSVRWWRSTAEAMQQFRFFVSLRSNRINYIASTFNCDCTCNIYIREVLVQSAMRFRNPAAAWGATGIERLICVSQANNSFHTYLNKANCCSSFYVACGNPQAVHPCIYDTPDRRDRALTGLIKSAAEFSKFPFPGIFLSQDQKSIYDINKKPLAAFIDPFDGQRQVNFCVKLFYLWGFMIKRCNYGLEQDNKPFLKNDNDELIAVAFEEMSLEEFRGRMQESAYYFPLVKTQEEGIDKYCVEVKFPVYPRAPDGKREKKDCGCNDEREPADETPCYIAWKSSCCLSTCNQAFIQYTEIIELLRHTENYHPVFDCVCNSYGIRLHTVEDVVGFNPQCYDTAERACDAVSRARRLINSEGLHLVEHILLRPHCENECGCLINNGDPCEVTHCDSFRWKADESVDPCIRGEDICFVPGADPYSFIATIALPSWPERFRSKEGRELVERMLYREAPAHVMLRILWLAPHDLCCFENHFKKWSRYLAGKNTCTDNYTICSFLDFLFKRNYECLQDCTECECANTPKIDRSQCFDMQEGLDRCNIYPFLNQVNEYFCWTKQDCCNYQFVECEPLTRDRSRGDMNLIAVDAISSPTEPLPEVPAPVVDEIDAWLRSEERADLINGRNARYRSAVNEVVIVTAEGENPIPPKAKSFLRKPSPKFSQLKDVIEETIGNKAPGVKKLSKKQVTVIVANTLLYYLDRVWFNGSDTVEMDDIITFIKLHEKKLGLPKIYSDWNIEEVEKIQPGADTTAVRKLVTG